MSAQTKYSFSTPLAVAGGIADISDYSIASRTCEADTGVLKPGMGVIVGSVPGKNVKAVAAGATAGKFEGVVVNGMTTQYDLDGKMRIEKGATVGVMEHGKVWVRVPEDVTIAYGDDVYLVLTGDDAGLFTNSKTATDTALTFVQVKARFVGAADTMSTIAPVELFNQAQG